MFLLAFVSDFSLQYAVFQSTDDRILEDDIQGSSTACLVLIDLLQVSKALAWLVLFLQMLTLKTLLGGLSGIELSKSMNKRHQSKLTQS